MTVRRYLLETATLVVVAVAIALVSNALASRERKLKLPGDYPNATVVPTRPAAEGSSAPSQAASAESSPATAQQGSVGSSSKGESAAQDASAESYPAAAQPGSGGLPSKGKTPALAAVPLPRGAAATVAESSPSKKIPGTAISPAPPLNAASAADLLSRFPPHPDKPFVEISGEDAGRLWAAGVPFLDARRTSAYEEGHVAGA
ncbi:MAG TPA: hypothetical protein VLH41_06245, partial [Thermoanaerobaculia bacterium]|nr:hypothetical protein [Thermoanaerobaculia bacterium]